VVEPVTGLRAVPRASTSCAGERQTLISRGAAES